jgi:hypothetical protein
VRTGREGGEDREGGREGRAYSGSDLRFSFGSFLRAGPAGRGLAPGGGPRIGLRESGFVR